MRSSSTEHKGSLVWRKANKSNPNGECVELAATSEGGVALRNSRDPNGPVLLFTKGEIEAWLDGARKREFDDLTV